jgi:hypothetical protein
MTSPIIIYAWRWWSQVMADVVCIFIGPISIFISGKPYLQRPLCETNFTNYKFIYMYLYYSLLRHY